jgi:hypothetical protein
MSNFRIQAPADGPQTDSLMVSAAAPDPERWADKDSTVNG